MKIGAIIATINPIPQKIVDTIIISFECFLSLEHASLFESIGQLLLLDNETRPAAISKAATVNVIALYSDRVTNTGRVLTKLATTAPKPRKTSSAGSAQQKSVVVETKSIRYLI